MSECVIFGQGDVTTKNCGLVRYEGMRTREIVNMKVRELQNVCNLEWIVSLTVKELEFMAMTSSWG